MFKESCAPWSQFTVRNNTTEVLTNVQGKLCSMESVHCEEQHD